MMEWWNDETDRRELAERNGGMVEGWNNGMMEHWNDAFLIASVIIKLRRNPNIPILQYSNIPTN